MTDRHDSPRVSSPGAGGYTHRGDFQKQPRPKPEKKPDGDKGRKWTSKS